MSSATDPRPHSSDLPPAEYARAMEERRRQQAERIRQRARANLAHLDRSEDLTHDVNAAHQHLAPEEVDRTSSDEEDPYEPANQEPFTADEQGDPQGIPQSSAGNHGMWDEPRSGASRGNPLGWPEHRKNASELVGHARYWLERSGGELDCHMMTMADQLLTARDAHFKRMERALDNLLMGAHPSPDDISKAKKYVSKTAAAYKQALLRFQIA